MQTFYWRYGAHFLFFFCTILHTCYQPNIGKYISLYHYYYYYYYFVVLVNGALQLGNKQREEEEKEEDYIGCSLQKGFRAGGTNLTEQRIIKSSISHTLRCTKLHVRNRGLAPLWIHGSGLFCHIPCISDQIGNGGTWRPGRHLEILVTFLSRGVLGLQWSLGGWPVSTWTPDPTLSQSKILL